MVHLAAFWGQHCVFGCFDPEPIHGEDTFGGTDAVGWGHTEGFTPHFPSHGESCSMTTRWLLGDVGWLGTSVPMDAFQGQKSELLQPFFTQFLVSLPNAAPRPADPNLLHADADALQRLVALSHGHSRECGFIPDVKPPAPGSLAPLVWECVAGHRFSWGGPSAGDAPQRCDGAGGGSERGSPPVPVRRRSLRRTGVVVEPMVEEPSAVKDDAVWSPGGGGDGGGDGGEFGLDGITE